MTVFSLRFSGEGKHPTGLQLATEQSTLAGLLC